MKATFMYGAGDVRVEGAHAVIEAGHVFDRTLALVDTPTAYAAMDSRDALKVMLIP